MALSKTDVLCGPIVRKVTTEEVSIWIALKSAARIELTVWQGMISCDADGEIVETPVSSVSQDTVEIGKNLHMSVIRLPLSGDKLLEWGLLYSYNLAFTTADDVSEDFKSLGLLDVSDVSTGYTILSYQADQLPGFALPAGEIDNLKIVHGSCRNNDNRFEDALSFLDDILQESLANPLKRPQQLFLSGDQIYADSVVGSLLHHLIGLGNQLLDNRETLTTTGEDPQTQARFPADINHFPPFIRRRLIDSEARFTTTSNSNHLISFGEFVGMYLSVWSDTSWPDDIDSMKSFEDVFNAISTVPENSWTIFRRNLFDERSGAKELVDVALINKCLEFLFGIQDKEILRTLLSGRGSQTLKGQASRALVEFLDGADSPDEKQELKDFIDYLQDWIGTLFPRRNLNGEDLPDPNKVKVKILNQTLPKVKRALANISTMMIFDDHDVTDDWNLNPSWRDRVFTSPLGKAIVRNGMMAYALFQDWGNRAERYNRKGYFFELDLSFTEDLNTEQLTESVRSAFADNGVILDIEQVVVQLLHSDEWLLRNIENKDEFLIRKYKKNVGDDAEILKVLGNPHAHLLEQIGQLFSGQGVDIPELEDHVDFLFGLDFQHRLEGSAGGRQQLPDNRSPLIKWHFRYEGAKHKVLAIDNRTRRSFVEFHGAPGNLSFNGMKDLIPENPSPVEDEVLFVIAPLPVLGPSLLDELVAPLAYKVFDMVEYFKDGEAVKSGMKGTNPDAIEAWAFDPVSQEELLKRLAPFKRIIFLSGDVHYGSSQRLSYWVKDKTKPIACFAQLTSSGFRNIMPSYIQTASQHYLNAQKLIRQNIRAERLGWHKHDINPDPLDLPVDSKSSFLFAKLKTSPVIIPVNGWPLGTKIGRNPDWSWRIENVLDIRKEEKRPKSTQVSSIEEADDVMKTIQKIAIRHIGQAKKVNYTRQILFKVNLGMVSFEKSSTDQVLHVVHDLHAVPAEGKPDTPQKHEVYSRYKIRLEATDDEKAPTIDQPTT